MMDQLNLANLQEFFHIADGHEDAMGLESISGYLPTDNKQDITEGCSHAPDWKEDINQGIKNSNNLAKEKQYHDVTM